MVRVPHFVRDKSARGDLRNSRRDHRRVAVNKRPGKRIRLAPTRVDSLARLNSVPGRRSSLHASQRHDRAIPQHAAQAEYR